MLHAGIGHIINNAYGVQSAALCAAITAAGRRGRLDAFVQSTDKNFMVPVGGAVIAAPSSRRQLVEAVNQAYPGRAGMAPLLDALITLLHWGAKASPASLCPDSVCTAGRLAVSYHVADLWTLISRC